MPTTRKIGWFLMGVLLLVSFISACEPHGMTPTVCQKEVYLVQDETGAISFQLPDWPSFEGRSMPMIQAWALREFKFGYMVLDQVPASFGADGVIFVETEPEQPVMLVVVR